MAPFAPSLASSAPSRALWFNAFIALLVLLPLPFGANRPWASNLFALLCALLLMAFSASLIRTPDTWRAFEGAPLRRLKISATLLGLVALWSFLQTQSWMPLDWHHPLWTEVPPLPDAFLGSISIEPDLFAESLARILAYVACFLFAFFGARDGARAHKLLFSLAIAAVIYAFYGLLMQSTGLHMVLWYKKWWYEDWVTSTFVNKNSYATYAGLGLQACLALLWQHMKRKPEGERARRSLKAAWVEKIGTRGLFLIIMCLVVLGALLMSGSRAGLASSLLGCLTLLMALAVNRRWGWRRWAPLLLLSGALIVGLAIFSDMAFIDHFERTQIEGDSSERLAAYSLAVNAIESNPWRGFGLGSFENAFRLYRDTTLRAWFHHAHNDYLELAIELGIPAALAFLSAILLLLSCCVDGVRHRKRREIYPALALAASITVGTHSLVDFSMQIPAVAATYVTLLGLGVAQSWSSRRED